MARSCANFTNAFRAEVGKDQYTDLSLPVVLRRLREASGSHRVPGLFHEIIGLLLEDVEEAECPPRAAPWHGVYAIKVGYWSWLPLKQLAAERGDWTPLAPGVTGFEHRLTIPQWGPDRARDDLPQASHDAQNHALAQIYQTVQAQASVLSYIDLFQMLAVFAALMVPIVLLMRKPPKGARAAAH